MHTVYVNGKFTAQRTTGVQRVARQLVLALDALPPAGRWVLLTPPGVPALPLRHIEQRAVGTAGRPLHAWEQASLTRAARDGLLLNLAGSAPYFARRQAALLHDAAVFDHPAAYTPAFAAWYRRLFQRLGRRAEQLFTVSEFSRQRLAACLGVPAARFTVLHNGADHLDAVAPDARVLDLPGLRGRRFLLAVGSANPTKNLDALVAAFTGLPPDSGLALVIVGGHNARVFAGAATPPADPPGVLRIGELEDPPLKALYQAATALVFPSLYEGFGLPPLEAMRLGCPVLAARAASIPEVCGDAALYFDPRSVDEIGESVRRLLANPEGAGARQAAGRERAAAFTWRAAALGLHGALRPA